MTFNPAALAIDGAKINSALARTETYHATSGAEGITQKDDLKVTALASPGLGVRIGAGAGVILNRYISSQPDQMYTVANPETHTMLPADMSPLAVSGTAKSYILAVTIGDPEFSQAGHPWMLASDPPSGQAETFRYVRPIIIPVASSSVVALNVAYPAMVLARIDLPANVSAIQDSHITDLRKLARPRTKLEVGYTTAPSGENPLNVSVNQWERFPNVKILEVDVPDWAVKAKVMGFVEGLRLEKAGIGSMQAYVEDTALVGGTTNIDEYSPKQSKDRRSYNVGGEIDVRSIAGTRQKFSVRAGTTANPSKGFLVSVPTTSAMLWVYFEEQPT